MKLASTAVAVVLSVAVAGAALVHADDRVGLQVDTSEADAVLAILARRRAGEAVAAADWSRLFATEPYLRLKRRETEMKRSFSDDDFRRFVLSDELLARHGALERTVREWKAADLVGAARRVLGYLPAEARIRARVYPVIKPQTNTFVFEARTDPAIFLYVDPALSAARFTNTVSHELHHIGLASLADRMSAAQGQLPPREKAAAEWMGAFGEGMAMLAAAGGPDIHPHEHSPAEDRARWDRDVGRFAADQKELERFFLDVIDGRLAGEEAIRQKAFSFFGEQGPWYTVGWRMAALVERRYGRDALVACMLDPRRLLATYNRAVADRQDPQLPPWSPRLIEAVRAVPAGH
jgi:hypothetical protein